MVPEREGRHFTTELSFETNNVTSMKCVFRLAFSHSLLFSLMLHIVGVQPHQKKKAFRNDAEMKRIR